MDLSRISLFSLLGKRMAFLGRRQEILSQNIANANTPGYRAKDIREDGFKSMLAGHAPSLTLKATDAAHIGMPPPAVPTAEVVESPDTPAGPDGNTVELQDEMVKVGETAAQYQMVTSLYRKQLNMIRIAIGRGR